MFDNHLMVLGPGLVLRGHFGIFVFKFFLILTWFLFQGRFGNFKCLKSGYFGA